MNKVTVIGTGCVGATIAYTIAATKLASEILLIDINEAKAHGEAMDIRQGMPFCGPVSIRSGNYDDAKDSNIVVITSGVPRKPGQTRLDLTQTNVNIMKQIMPQITKAAPDAVYIIVSNPVDVLTYMFIKQSGIPEERIIGSGTILDTARLRSRLSEYYDINQQNVHAYVFGEHGDSAIVPWSLATISNVPMDQFQNSLVTDLDKNLEPINKEDVLQYIHKSGGKVISEKGATFYAVSLSVIHLIRSILCGIDTSLTVSTMMHGEYGIEDVCLSTINMVGHNGVNGKVVAPLTDDELKNLRHSAEVLKDVISKIDFS